MNTTTPIAAPVAALARVLLALMFILAGAAKFAGLAGTAGYIASKGLPAPMLLAVAAGTLELVGGLALALGFHARWAALALGLFTIVVTPIFHPFWAVPADQAMVTQLLFMKNVSVAGGLLFVFSLGAGPASLDARRA